MRQWLILTHAARYGSPSACMDKRYVDAAAGVAGRLRSPTAKAAAKKKNKTKPSSRLAASPKPASGRQEYPTVLSAAVGDFGAGTPYASVVCQGHLGPLHLSPLLCTSHLTAATLPSLCSVSNATSWPTAWSPCQATTPHSPAVLVRSTLIRLFALSFLTPFRRNPASVADRPSFLTSCLHCLPLQPRPPPRDPCGLHHGYQSASGEQSGPLRCHSRSYDV